MNNNNYYMNQNSPFMNNLMQLLNMGANPQQIVQNAIAYNPQLQQVFSQINGKNLTTKEVVMQLAQKRGIDLNPMIQYIQQTKGIKM